MGKSSKRQVKPTKKKPAKKAKPGGGSREPAGNWRVKCLDPFDNDVLVEFPVQQLYFRGSETGPSWGTP